MDTTVSIPTLAGVPPYVGQATYGGAPPVIAASKSARPPFRIHWGYTVLLVFLMLPFLCGLGIASFFFQSSPSRALRDAVMDSVPGHWHKRIAINVGDMTFGLVRLGSLFIHQIPPEPRAAINAIRGADVGVYRLGETPSTPDVRSILAKADKSMHRRGWERIVGVAQPGQFVAVYVPNDLDSAKNLACSVVVLNDQDLVVVTAHGDITSLLELARKNMHGRVPLLDDLARR